jgi:archaellum component FlaC
MSALSSEMKLLQWKKKLLKLQCSDAEEETKDWQQLRVTNHLKQVISGTAKNEENELSNSLDMLAIAEGAQNSQLLRFERESERLATRIEEKAKENELLMGQIKDVRKNIDKFNKEYKAITEVRLQCVSEQ